MFYLRHAFGIGTLRPLQPVDGLEVAIHVTLVDGPVAIRAVDLLSFEDFLALALVAGSQPAVAHIAELVVLAAVCMALVPPFAASRTLHALGTVTLQEREGTETFLAVGAALLKEYGST